MLVIGIIKNNTLLLKLWFYTFFWFKACFQIVVKQLFYIFFDLSFWYQIQINSCEI